jgi:hypothetical protein
MENNRRTKQPMKHTFLCFLIIGLLIAVGCGGNTNAKTNPVTGQKLVDPSGNWAMQFTDSSSNTFILSGLFSQTGAIVTGIHFSEAGETLTINFTCGVQPDISLANGLVQNVNQFSGTLAGNFGTIAFNSVLNDAGTHAAGTYTVTPGALGNCLGVALTGTFVADEVPSMTGNWSGTITCTAQCPIGSINGTISMSLTQDDATGNITGSYTVSGLPGLSGGNLVPDPANDNILSGHSIQQRLQDNTAGVIFMVGGPLNSLGTAGVGLDRTFQGSIVNGGGLIYSISMSH